MYLHLDRELDHSVEIASQGVTSLRFVSLHIIRRQPPPFEKLFVVRWQDWAEHRVCGRACSFVMRSHTLQNLFIRICKELLDVLDLVSQAANVGIHHERFIQAQQPRLVGILQSEEIDHVNTAEDILFQFLLYVLRGHVAGDFSMHQRRLQRVGIVARISFGPELQDMEQLRAIVQTVDRVSGMLQCCYHHQLQLVEIEVTVLRSHHAAHFEGEVKYVDHCT